MKKNIKISIITLLFLALNFACTRDAKIITESQQIKPFEPIEKIIDDEVFISLVENNISQAQKVKNINVIGKFVSNGKNLTNNEKKILSKNLGFDNMDKMNTFFIKQDIILKHLEQKYNLSSYRKNELSQIILKGKYFSNEAKIQVVNGGGCNCERLRRNCLIEAFATSVLAHIGCSTIDAFGVGILCHSAVLIAQAAASDSCNADAENCLANCNTE